MWDKPVRPDEADCCGGGCKPCVFDVYEERLRKWELKKSFTTSRALDQIKYLPFLITSIQNLSDFLLVYHFQAVTVKNNHTDSVYIENSESNDFEILEEFLQINSGEYLILKGIYENETISRSYTPVLCKEDFQNGNFRVIISLQANGKMSGFLKKLQINDIVYWRGPFQEFTTDFKSFQNVLLFGGGTGMVPLYNIAKTIVEDEECEIWVSLVAGFKSTDNIILRDQFGRLRDFWNFKMRIFISSQVQGSFKPNHNETVMFGRIDETVIKEEVEKCGGNKFLVVVCGPEGFNHFVEDGLKRLGVSDENIFIFW